jgi:hypothetical protein
VKSQHSLIDFPDLTSFYQYYKYITFIEAKITFIYDANLHGIVFRLLAREFESVEIFPGFSLFLVENWVFLKPFFFCEITTFSSRLLSFNGFFQHHENISNFAKSERKACKLTVCHRQLTIGTRRRLVRVHPW